MNNMKYQILRKLLINITHNKIQKMKCMKYINV